MCEKKDREKIYIQAEEKTDRPIFRPIFEEREIKKKGQYLNNINLL